MSFDCFGYTTGKGLQLHAYSAAQCSKVHYMRGLRHPSKCVMFNSQVPYSACFIDSELTTMKYDCIQYVRRSVCSYSQYLSSNRKFV